MLQGWKRYRGKFGRLQKTVLGNPSRLRKKKTGFQMSVWTYLKAGLLWVCNLFTISYTDKFHIDYKITSPDLFSPAVRNPLPCRHI